MATPCRAAWRTSLLSTRGSSPRALVLLLLPPSSSRRRTISTWTARTAHPSSRVQIFTSHSHDPYLNLSAEHLLLQRSHPASTVLFLYANDPCVVIGRNQNPWVEADLGLLSQFPTALGGRGGGQDESNSSGGHGGGAALVRRRSGGGAVFHDRGNVNYSVICPSAAFDRDLHADMVARALRRLGVSSARVNARHDIVVSSSSFSSSDDHDDDGSSGADLQQPFKVSGSAYKLTRLRSLHHGTCLLSSHLAGIGQLLRSPAEPFIKARGVESVRSRIQNLGLARDEFMGAVVDEFTRMYGDPDVELPIGEESRESDFSDDEIQRGYRELTVGLRPTSHRLKSPWVWLILHISLPSGSTNRRRSLPSLRILRKRIPGLGRLSHQACQTT